MANDYYTNASDVVAGNKAKAEDINSRMELIESGFDKLPSCVPEAPASKGFDERFVILDSTEEYHPPTSKQVRDGSLTFAVDTGTANTIIADLPQAPSAYTTGMSITIQLNATNTGATTVNLNDLGAKAVKRISGDDLTAGDIIAGRVIGMRYNGTHFQLLDGMYAIHNHSDMYYTEDEVDSLVGDGSLHSHDDTYYTEAEVDVLLSAIKIAPVGSTIPWIGGYFTNSSNGGFTSVLGNTAAAANAYLNSLGWHVANGAALNLSTSPIFNGTGRYLANITDDRFLMGDTAAGTTGGSSTMSHYHGTYSHALTVDEMPEHNHAAKGDDASFVVHDPDITTRVDAGSTYNWGTATTRTDYTGSNQPHSHGDTGSASNTENRPKFLACLYITRTH